MLAGERFEFMSKRISCGGSVPGIAWTVDHADQRVWATVGTHRMTRSGTDLSSRPHVEWLPLDDVEFIDD